MRERFPIWAERNVSKKTLHVKQKSLLQDLLATFRNLKRLRNGTAALLTNRPDPVALGNPKTTRHDARRHGVSAGVAERATASLGPDEAEASAEIRRYVGGPGGGDESCPFLRRLVKMLDS